MYYSKKIHKTFKIKISSILNLNSVSFNIVYKKPQFSAFFVIN